MAERRGQTGGAGEQAMAIGEALRAFSTEMNRYIDAHGEPHGLHRTDIYALSELIDGARAEREVTPGALADALNLSPPATSAMLQRLEKAGHVHRRPSETDRRRVVVETSPEAMAVGSQIFAPIGMAMGRMLAGFTEAEQAVILRFLTETVETTRSAQG